MWNPLRCHGGRFFWRRTRPGAPTSTVGKKKKKRNVGDEETTRKLIAALEEESIKYETYFKLIIATGMRRGECCGLKWKDVDFSEKSIHICRNVVKVTGEISS